MKTSYNTAKPIRHDALKTGDAFGKIPSFAFAPIFQMLTPGELKLFMYYALQADGFCPSYAEIKKQTGILKPNTIVYRKRLIAKRFICYDTDAEGRNLSIRICWDNIRRIKQEMMLSAKITSKNGINPIPITHMVSNVGIHEKTIEEQIKESNSRVSIYVGHESTPLTKSEQNFYNKIKGFTPSEYNEMIHTWNDNDISYSDENEPAQREFNETLHVSEDNHKEEVLPF